MLRALLTGALVLCSLPSAALAQSGGAAAPTEAGGTEYGTPIKPVRTKPRPAPPVASQFAVAPGQLQAGAPVRFTWRIDGGRGQVRVRVALVKNGTRIVARNLKFGRFKTGRVHRRTWTPAAGELPPGTYTARLHAVDRAGRALRRSATASGRSPLEITVAPKPVTNGVFPVQGRWTYGGEGAQFGADRGSHIHQGQDIMAAKGTPLVSPVAGTVFFSDYQPSGAGHYLVIRGEDGRDYVFMHLVEG